MASEPPGASTTTILRREGETRLRLRRLLLVVTAGPDAGQELTLLPGAQVLGRGAEADLRLEDPAVSRRHCELVVDAEGVRLSDLASRGGPRANGLVVDAVRLEPGARIEVGESVLELTPVETELPAPAHDADEYEGLRGASPPMRELFGLVTQVAPLPLPVLIHGETGTGKEGLAGALHRRGARPDGPFEVVDCTLLTDPTHARSELFGHASGAFTGAAGDREGAFVRADGGTLFLDEVGELPGAVQAQLLRVLQDGAVRPLGSDDDHRVDVRLVSATHRDLAARAREGAFRADLFFRLAGVTLEVPPLRERGEDLPLLARHFLPAGASLAPDAEAALRAHPWPGNVRELRFVLERAAALAPGGRVHAGDLSLEEGAPPRPSGAPRGSVRSARRRVAALTAAEITAALRACEGNRKAAAEALGISRATLYRKLREFELD